MRKRSESGKFIAQSEERREVRSLRLTDSTWKALGDTASQQGITRADLIEKLIKEELLTIQSQESQELAEDQKEQRKTVSEARELLLKATNTKNITDSHRKLLSRVYVLLGRLM